MSFCSKSARVQATLILENWANMVASDSREHIMRNRSHRVPKLNPISSVTVRENCKKTLFMESSFVASLFKKTDHWWWYGVNRVVWILLTSFALDCKMLVFYFMLVPILVLSKMTESPLPAFLYLHEMKFPWSLLLDCLVSHVKYSVLCTSIGQDLEGPFPLQLLMEAGNHQYIVRCYERTMKPCIW